MTVERFPTIEICRVEPVEDPAVRVMDYSDVDDEPMLDQRGIGVLDQIGRQLYSE